MSRYDYVRYDEPATATQNAFKEKFEELGKMAAKIDAPRALALFHTKLEEAYMWLGKAIRDDQVLRNQSAPLQEERKNG